jgi:plastocyanin
MTRFLSLKLLKSYSPVWGNSRKLQARSAQLAITALLGAAILAGAGPAAGSAYTIQLQDTGPNPQTLTVAVGDVITFTNAGIENHDILAPTANYTAPLLRPGQSTSLTMSKAGKLPYVETGFTHSHRGMILVTATSTGQSALSLESRTAFVVFGANAALTGHTTLPPGTSIVLVSHAGSRAPKRCTATATSNPQTGWAPVGAPTQVGPDSTFAFTVAPSIATSYRAQAPDGSACSLPIMVQVRPVVTMSVSATKTKTGRPVTIRAAVRPAAAATSLVLFAYNKTSGIWRKVMTAPTTPAGTARLTFIATQGTTRLHVAMSTKGGARGAYLAGTSASRTVTGVGAPPAAASSTHKHKHVRKKH